MCSGRVDLSFVLRAFSNGMDGVYIGGCHLNECHYVTDGNYHALATVLLCKKLMELIRLNPDRLKIEWTSAGEGIRFAEIMNDFAKELKEIGPLGKGRGEGTDASGLKLNLDALVKLVPYIRLVERERLRVSSRSEDAYLKLYAGDETNRLFNELIADKLAISRILLLLDEKDCSTAEISERLGMSPSEVSRHMNSSSRQGLVRYDTDRKRYALSGMSVRG